MGQFSIIKKYIKRAQVLQGRRSWPRPYNCGAIYAQLPELPVHDIHDRKREAELPRMLAHRGLSEDRHGQLHPRQGSMVNYDATIPLSSWKLQRVDNGTPATRRIEGPSDAEAGDEIWQFLETKKGLVVRRDYKDEDYCLIIGGTLFAPEDTLSSPKIQDRLKVKIPGQSDVAGSG
jgi:hypothetical protein